MRIIRISLFIFALVSAVALVRSVYDLWQKGSILEAEEERFARARYTNEELRQQDEELKDPMYIEKQAREKLGLSRPGEAVVVLPPDNSVQTIETDRAGVFGEKTAYEQWIAVILD